MTHYVASRTRCGAIALALTFLAPSAARADWFLVPGFGITFASQTNLIDLELATGRATKLSIQGSGVWLGEGWLGFEGEVSYIADFFGREFNLQNAEARLVTRSAVTTAMGGVVVSTPLSWTRHSLRPYGVVGFGLIRATARDVLAANSFEANLAGWRFGAGATGFLSDTVGLRWDLSYFRTLKGQGQENVVVAGSRSLTFWQGSMGLVLRF